MQWGENMKFYEPLYVSAVYREKKKQIIKDIQDRKMLLHTYLILLSSNHTMQLEIIHAAQLSQKNYPLDDLFLVGIASNYYEALDIVEQITRTVYNETHEVEIKEYLIKNNQNKDR